MWHNPFRGMTKREWLLWAVSSLTLLVSHLCSGSTDPLTLIATQIGAAFLILLARGDVWGQILTIVFSVLYGIIAWRCRYWGEMLTYLGMTAPMALLAVISWLRHPFQGDHAQVEIARMSRCGVLRMLLVTLAVTAVAGYLLCVLHTPNLPWSIVSVATSFLAAYLTYCRSPWYAAAFAANDAVLIVLWVLMSLQDRSNIPVAVNFFIFLINDSYGFISWRRRQVLQSQTAENP